MASDPPQRWQLWREDDNGNRSLVATSTDRAPLQGKRRDLESGGHKQIYWISAASGQGDAD
jgi:hypothetical protein